MNYLKRIRQKIDDFCINKMRMDGAQHLIAGILIYDMLKYLMPVEAAILTTLVILVAKEIVWDKWLKNGTEEWHDLVWGAEGFCWEHFDYITTKYLLYKPVSRFAFKHYFLY